jgi:hypothetical protein
MLLLHIEVPCGPIIDKPASIQSNAAEASKSVSTPGDDVCLDRSKNKTLFSTALLHVCPGSAYWESSRAENVFAWRISQ